MSNDPLGLGKNWHFDPLKQLYILDPSPKRRSYVRSYCTSCGSHFSESPVEHVTRFCPHKNGCPRCGDHFVDAGHVRQCGGKYILAHCSNCGESYQTDAFTHRTKDCQYYLGCKMCRKKWMGPVHFRECRGSESRPMMANTEGLLIVCEYCEKDIPSPSYTAHALLCYKEHSPHRSPARWCENCEDRLPLDEFDAHLKDCLVEYGMPTSRTHYPHDIQVVDLRLKEKAVKFLTETGEVVS